MPVFACRFVRKMQGGAQAHLLEADDGLFYVVKFRNNPQHLRVLVNEWLGNTILRFLRIATPHADIICLGKRFLANNPEIYIAASNSRVAVQPGLHFGSQYPGHPDKIAVYDFVPDTLLAKIVNLTDFFGTLVFDKWTGNADARQSVFLRTRVCKYAPQRANHPLCVDYISLMMDNGWIFNGPEWSYVDSPLLGLYFSPIVYHQVRGWHEFEPWLELVKTFPEGAMDEALLKLPREWLNGDTNQLNLLLEKLMRRRNKVADLIADCKRGRQNPFPNWS